MKFVIFAIVLSVFVNLTFADSAAQLGEYPFHASLWVHDESYNRLCDGALIRYNWILTAAHCIYNATSVYVRLGTVDLALGSEWYTYIEDSSDLYVTDSFRADNPYVNDIGLIYLQDADASIISNQFIGTINFLSDTSANLDYVSSTVTGFGPSVDDFTTVLRYVRAPIMTQSWCQSVHGTRIDSGMLCTDTIDDQSPCLEDSGAPLMATIAGQQTVVGIGSVWENQCTAAHHGVFTRVANHASWIQSTIDSRR